MKLKSFSLIFLIFLAFSCSQNSFNKENLKKIVLKEDLINTDIWEIQNISLIEKEKLNLYEKNNCFKIKVSYELEQKKMCYFIKKESILENNIYIKKIKKMLEIPIDNNKYLYQKGYCLSKSELNSELDKILLEEKDKIGTNYCTRRNNILFGNECLEYSKYEIKDYEEAKARIIQRYNRDLQNLEKIENNNKKMVLIRDVCSNDGKLSIFKY